MAIATRETSTTIAGRELLTTREAARRAGLTPGGVRAWERRGWLTDVVHTPYGRLVPVDALERAIAAKAASPDKRGRPTIGSR